MNTHDATEQAYRNGYDAGYKAAQDKRVICKDCKHHTNLNPMYYCTVWGSVHGLGELGFCSYGERKEDE